MSVLQSDPADAVQTIKNQFLQNTGSQTLVYSGTVQPSMLKTIPDDGKIQLFFKTLTNRTRVIRAKPDATILELKQLFFDSDGVPVDAQRLIWGGKELEDDRTLQFYNIQQESTIYPVLRLRGGRKGGAGSLQTLLAFSTISKSSIPYDLPPASSGLSLPSRAHQAIPQSVWTTAVNRVYKNSSQKAHRKSKSKPPGFRRKDFSSKRSGRDLKSARNDWGSDFNPSLFEDQIRIQIERSDLDSEAGVGDANADADSPPLPSSDPKANEKCSL